ncbi:MAG: UDP-N-acetylmuramyl-tripeptide synthetase [Patescibacteria group bacterium]
MILDHIKKYIPAGIFRRLQPIYHFVMAFAAAAFYCFPARRLIVIGVTGTKGKTTVVELLHAILEEAGHNTASLSSLRFRIRDQVIANDLKMTMPGRFFVQKFLREAVERGVTHVVLEVTSEGIKQYRHRFIGFNVAVMTNVRPEHIEAHGGFEEYLRAKLDLFWRLPAKTSAVLNVDDPGHQRFRAATRAHIAEYGHAGIRRDDKFWPVRDASFGADRIRFDLGGREVRSALRGEFNFYNILAAAAVALSLHINLRHIADGVARVKEIPGRMEFIQDKPFRVVVDYAHTPDSLGAVYGLLGGAGKKLICVLGAAGGGRDKWKRPEMGRIAADHCDAVFLTNEDPYDEDPQSIIADIAAGCVRRETRKEKRGKRKERPEIHKILDRGRAIRAALEFAERGDTVVITGKGAEPWIMGPGGGKTPWDDREIAREFLEGHKKS